MDNNLTKLNSDINYLKIIAAFCVYLCHSLIVTLELAPFNLPEGLFFFKAPAWGGVWIFFIVSGFLSAEGFCTKKYTINKKGILKFYKNKVLNILLPTIIFISLIYILIEPENLNLIVIVKYITLTFIGSGGATGIGATWYVFTLMRLYFLTPLFMICINKIEQQTKHLYIFLSILLLFGIGYRIVGRYLGLDWYSNIYVSVIGNIDLYVGGILLNALNKNNTQNIHHKNLAWLLLLLLLIFCSYCFYCGGRLQQIYMYICPSLFLVLVGIILQNSKYKVVSHPIDRLIIFLSANSFEFYLWHSLILYKIIPVIKIKNSFYKYLIITTLVSILTMYIAYLMTILNKTIKEKINKIYDKSQ